MQRGEVYFVSLNPVIGREQHGRRPVLVVSIDSIIAAPLVVTVVPSTDGKKVSVDYPTTVRVPAADSGLPYETVFLCFQIRALDKSRFPDQPAGRLDSTWMGRIAASLRYCLGV